MLTQAQIDAALGQNTTSPTGQPTTAGLRGKALVDSVRSQVSAEPEDTDNIIQSFIKSTGIPGLAVGGFNVAQAGADVAFAQPEKAEEDLNKARNIPFLGKVEPTLKSTDTTGEMAKKGLGSALEVASTIAGGGATKGVLQQGSKGMLKSALKIGAKEGALSGGAQGAGSALTEDKGLGETVAQGVVGGVTGGALGSVLTGLVTTLSPTARKEIIDYLKKQTSQKVTKAVDKVGGAVGNVITTLSEDPTVKTMGSVGKDLVEKGSKYIKGAPERVQINEAQKVAEKQALEALEPRARKAVESGVEARDVKLLQSTTPEEKSVLKRMHKMAKDYAEDEMSDDPASLVGHEIQSRVKGVEELKTKMGEEMGAMAQKVTEAPDATGVRKAVFDRLTQVPGLKGLRLNLTNLEEPLDFSRTAMRGKGNANARKSIIEEFNDLIGLDNEQLHLKRQELFESLGGKKSSLQALGESEDKAYQAIRQGLADVLEGKVPGYKEANLNFAQVAEFLREIRKLAKSIPGATDDILDEQAASLGRRLTSNAPSGVTLKNLLQRAEKMLGEKGTKFGTDVTKMQKLYNMFSKYYGLAKDTGLAGQVKLGTQEIPTSIKGATGILMDEMKNLTGMTEATRRKALEDLIDAL